MWKLTHVVNVRAFKSRPSSKKNVNYRRALILCNKVDGVGIRADRYSLGVRLRHPLSF